MKLPVTSCLTVVLIYHSRKDQSHIERKVPFEKNSSEIEETVLGLAVDLIEGIMLFCQGKWSSKDAGLVSQGDWSSVVAGDFGPTNQRGSGRKLLPYFKIEGKNPVTVLLFCIISPEFYCCK